MPGAVLLVPGQAGMIVNPDLPQPELAVAANFERFDGLSQPQLQNPAGQPNVRGSDNRPGQSVVTPDVYTPGPISGVVGVTGGQPLPVADCIHRGAGDYTKSRTPSIQFMLGVGQHGPSELGVAQTVALSQITGNPPVPGDLTSILAGWG